jgi:RNA polymerase sigma-70 factor (ECF subfamily)
MASMEQILDEHGDAVFAFLIQLSHCDADARDVFQELWRRLLDRPTQLNGLRDPRGYLLRLARNLFIDHIRSRDARVRAHDHAGEEAPSLFESACQPDELLFRHALSEALGALPEEQRAVIHLKLWEELTFEAIAQILDIPPNTAASRYRYGMDKLRVHLRPLYNEIRVP